MSQAGPNRGPDVVAHRGYAGRYPENTLPALEAAVDAGARYIEFDVQLSADGVPVVLHDADLRRTGGRPEAIADLTWPVLRDVEVCERARLGERFSGVTVPCLADVVGLLDVQPHVTAFVEVKREALRRFGTEDVVARVTDVIAPVSARCVLTSFDANALREGRRLGGYELAWVIEAFDGPTLEAAAKLAPEFLFCNYRKLPPNEPLPDGPWQWAVYEVTDGELARSLVGRGATLIETMWVAEMMAELGLIGGGP